MPTIRPATRLATGVLALAVSGTGLLALAPAASAATSYTVTTTDDTATDAGPCASSTSTTVPSPLSLREAVCLANNTGGTSTITLPTGTLSLTNGTLVLGTKTGQNTSVTGVTGTVITASARAFSLDPAKVGGVTVSLSTLSVTGTASDGSGGAAILGGSGRATTADSLAISNASVTGTETSGSSAARGGGVFFDGGSLTVAGSNFTGSKSKSASGGAIAYTSEGQAAGEGLALSNDVFMSDRAGTAAAGTGGGGALDLRALGPGASPSMSVSHTKFRDNYGLPADNKSTVVGEAILLESGALTVTGSTFYVNQPIPDPNGGGIAVLDGATAKIHYNIFALNNPAINDLSSSSTAVDDTENYFGCNPPFTQGCDAPTGYPVNGPSLELTVTASPSTVDNGGTSTITASFLTDSAGNAVDASQLDAFDIVTMEFRPTDGRQGGDLGTITQNADMSLMNGQATATYTAPTDVVGAATVTATAYYNYADNEALGTASVQLTVTNPGTPTFTSADTTTFTAGSPQHLPRDDDRRHGPHHADLRRWAARRRNLRRQRRRHRTDRRHPRGGLRRHHLSHRDHRHAPWRAFQRIRRDDHCRRAVQVHERRCGDFHDGYGEHLHRHDHRRGTARVAHSSEHAAGRGQFPR